ncbi:MAG: tRNA preQ1(34) S-adenosylmethionine ribosyltransferase-isomerase QueA [Pirellulales bacterium]|nr:tRNA preQ1(34) S-adenosylmethionine ribosyltransferase-isomerase QueA [Pirellulales bacterium]
MDAWFDYELPHELVAQEPLRNRVDARLMVIDRARQSIDHAHVRDLPELLRAGDRLVLNDTKVIPAQLRGLREQTGGRWQGLFLGQLPDGDWLLVCKTRGKIHEPERVTLLDREGRPAARLWLVERADDGQWRARPEDGELPLRLLERIGRVPLPPYIRSGNMVDSDVQRYQTVFARRPGAVAAPTAGLHFTADLLQTIARRGVGVSAVTLHVGMGTFRPISVDDPALHPMHAEWGELSEAAAREINLTRRGEGRIVAVGTTVVRVLETVAAAAAAGGVGDAVAPWQGETRLFIRPPYEFRATDAMLTNFHFPRTTLLLLVQALGGSELIRRAYETAITERYRFYSYGDAMLIQ